MKRKLILISLVLALTLTLMTPATALAKSDKWNNRPVTTNFSGSGLIYVTYMPDPIIKGKIWRYQGEITEGFLDQCDWDLLAGTIFWSEHDSVVTVDEQYNAKGMMRGTFSLTRPDGSGTLNGSFTGKIQGNLYTGDIMDKGTWRSTGGIGVFENAKASGSWSAELHYDAIPGTDIYTLVGPVTWGGKYVSYTPPEIIKPGKPIKPWKPGWLVKPGKPFKPWQPFKLARP
jgi:hypothetical protein